MAKRLLIVWTWFLGFACVASADDDLASELASRIAEIAKRYERWGATINYRTLQVPHDGGLIDRFASEEFDWANAIQWHHRILRDGIRFRVNYHDAEGGTEEFAAFDGKLLRVRSVFQSYNGPFEQPRIETGLYTLGPSWKTPELPHKIQLGRLYHDSALLWQVLGVHQPTTTDAIESGRIEYVEHREPLKFPSRVDWVDFRHEKLRSSPCIRITHTEALTSTNIWLSETHDLLPIRMSQRSSPQPDSVYQVIEWQKVSEGEIWMPRRIRHYWSDRDHTQVTEGTWEWDGSFEEGRNFRQIPVARSFPPVTHPPKVKPSGSIRKNVLRLRNNSDPWRPLLRFASQPMLWIIFLVGLTGFASFVSLFFVPWTQGGKHVQQIARRRRGRLMAVGILLFIAIGLLSTSQSGLHRFGFGLLSMGVFGLGWMLFMTVLECRRTIRLSSWLWATVCLAMVFAGYSRGVDRLVRQRRMFNTITAAGGRVGFVASGDDELPEWFSYFGEGFRGDATSVRIPLELFRREDIASWPLDDVESLSVTTLAGTQIGADVIEAIPSHCPLSAFVTQGVLDEDALRSLTRFDALDLLSFDCNGKPLGETVKQFQRVRDLTAANVLMDRQSLDVLAAMPQASNFYANQPVFPTATRLSLTPNGMPSPGCRVQITGGKVTATALELLGNVRGILAFSQSQFAFPQKASVQLQNCTFLAVHASNFTDSDLAMISGPNLRICTFNECKVTYAGMERFSDQRPEIAVVCSP